MRQVAGILIGHRGANFAHARIELDGREKFVDVLHQRGELLGAQRSSSSNSSYSLSVDPQPPALVMIASKPPSDQRVDILPRQLARGIAQAGVDVQRAAAGLIRRESVTSQPLA